jgi:HAD domain in Swiss Army Knife RNA repair proteins
VLVDVDGVLNPARSHAPGYRGQWVFPAGLAHRLLLNPSHGPMLTELAEVADAELVWATYWRNRANTWVAPRVGLPPLRFVPIPSHWRAHTRSSLGSWEGVPQWLRGSGRGPLCGSKTTRMPSPTSPGSRARDGT